MNVPSSSAAKRDGMIRNHAFLLVEGVSMMSLASAIEPLRQANRMLDEEFYRWQVGTVGGRKVHASNGIEFVGRNIEETVQDADILMVCAGAKVEEVDHRDVTRILRAAERRGLWIGGLSTGPEFLARAGLLDGHRCTVHWESRAAFRETYPNTRCTDKIFEIDGRRITCGGGIAVIDLMLHQIRAQNGEKIATSVANQFIHDRIRSTDDEQRTGKQPSLMHAPGSLRDSVRLMEQHVEDTLAIAQIAEHVGLSIRHLQRLFLLHLGVSPAQYYTEVRLRVGRELLIYSDQKIGEIAIATGFTSASHFATWFARIFGLRPSDIRRSRG